MESIRRERALYWLERIARSGEIMGVVSDIIKTDTSDAWSARLAEAGIMNERVNDYGDLQIGRAHV